MQEIQPQRLRTYQQAHMSDTPASDADLIRSTLGGNTHAFKTIYERYADRMYRIAYRFHGNHEDARDSVQDAFVNAYRSLGNFKAESQLATWLYRITMNACISKGRTKKRHETVDYPPLELIDHTSGKPYHDSRLASILKKEILRLREKHRSVFLLFAVEGFSHAEIGSILGIAENTSKSLYFRAKKTLVKRLEHYGITKNELIQ